MYMYIYNIHIAIFLWRIIFRVVFSSAYRNEDCLLEAQKNEWKSTRNCESRKLSPGELGFLDRTIIFPRPMVPRVRSSTLIYASRRRTLLQHDHETSPGGISPDALSHHYFAHVIRCVWLSILFFSCAFYLTNNHLYHLLIDLLQLFLFLCIISCEKFLPRKKITISVNKLGIRQHVQLIKNNQINANINIRKNKIFWRLR